MNGLAVELFKPACLGGSGQRSAGMQVCSDRNLIAVMNSIMSVALRRSYFPSPPGTVVILRLWPDKP